MLWFLKVSMIWSLREHSFENENKSWFQLDDSLAFCGKVLMQMHQLHRYTSLFEVLSEVIVKKAYQ